MAAIGAALVIACATWWCIAPRDVAPDIDDTHPNVGAPASSHVDRPTTSDRAAPDPTAPTDRTLAAAAKDASPATTHVLRVRLEGLDAEVPWTGRVHLRLEAQQRELFAFLGHDDRQKPDAGGRCAFELPGWWSRSTDRKWRLVATSDGYHRAERNETTDLDARDEVVLRVEPRRSLRGRVIDDLGRPVGFAAVTVLWTEAIAAKTSGASALPPVDHADTDERGSWRVTVPRDAEYAVIAEPPPEGRDGELDEFDAVGDVREPSAHPRERRLLVVASCAVKTNGRAVTDVPDLMLRTGVEVRGMVRWPDGAPVAHTPLHDVTTPFGRQSSSATERTDERGEFSMVVAAAGVTRLAIGDETSPFLLGAPFEKNIDPRGPVEIVLPEPTRIVAVLDDRSVDATLEVESGAAARCPADEGARVLATGAARVRAELGERRSAWRSIGPGDRGAKIALDLGAFTRQPLVVLCDDELKVTGVTIEWRHEDGRAERVECRRDSPHEPLRTMLEPGRYEVIVTAMVDRLATKYLLPTRRFVDVGTSPVFVPLERAIGGILSLVDARTDVDGPRTFEILDAQGNKCALGAGRRSLTTNSEARWSGVLAPGDYEVVIERPDAEPHRERVNIREREVTTVRVRL